MAASTGFLLVDLSDAGGVGGSGYKHDQTGRIDISAIKISIDRDGTTAAGTIKVGVITAITATGASITWFFTLDFSKSDQGHISYSENAAPSQFKCGVSAGAATRLVSNDKDTNNTRFQNDTAIAAATGSNVIPAVGDIVIDALNSAGTYAFSARVFYHAESSAS